MLVVAVLPLNATGWIGALLLSLASLIGKPLRKNVTVPVGAVVPVTVAVNVCCEFWLTAVIPAEVVTVVLLDASVWLHRPSVICVKPTSGICRLVLAPKRSS